MPTYRVHLTKALWADIEVEADNENAAIQAAFNSGQMPGEVCANCLGWGESWSADQDEWDVAEGLPGMPTGVEEITPTT
jgi:hypothetical protein